MVDEQLVMDLMERVRHRYYGKYRGTVTAVDEDTLRIKAKVPAVLQDKETGWCVACVPYAGPGVGIAFLPEEGAGVWIEFEGGDVSYPIWVGCYWRDGEKPDDAKPAVKVIVTEQGNKIVLDDDAQTITITDASDNKVTLSSDGMTLERGANKIVVSNAGMSVNDGALEVI
jgi:uncharacterized protein involved in type VI secretion and phage assembly